LKRSNRLILLIGFFLAAVAFVGIVLLLGSGGTTPSGPDRTMTTYTVAAKDIALGTTVTLDMVATKDVKIDEKPADAFTLAADAIGGTTTTDVLVGQKIGPQTFSTVTVNPDIGRLLDPGRVAMSIAVDQVSGVGTLVKPGDHVDVVVGITGADKFPVVTTNPKTDEVTPVAGLNSTSVKAIIQNAVVVGTLLPPPPAETGTETGTGAAPALNGQSQIVILAVTAQQAEVLRFAQMDGSLTLVLRSPEDKEAPNVETTGITLRRLVDGWAVIPPQIVEAVTATPKP
jgi:pilus assembly protein CpaB